MEANKIRIANISVPATTETPFALPKGCQWFQLQCRTAVAVRVGVEANKILDRYWTMKSGAVLKERDMNIGVGEGRRLFLYAASAVVVEALLGINEEEERSANE